jgi:hypothetical protein
MKVEYVPRAVDALEDAPASVQKAFRKQIDFLRDNLRHPSFACKEI